MKNQGDKKQSFLGNEKIGNLIKEKRVFARETINKFINGGGPFADFITKMADGIKKAVVNIPEDSEGRRFMINAAEQMSTANYIAMAYEIFLLRKVGLPITETLSHYNSWHTRDHNLLPEKLDETASKPSNLVSRRGVMRSMIGALGLASLNGGMGAKVFAPEQVNEEHRALINTAIVGGAATAAGIILLEMRDSSEKTADLLVNLVDKEIRSQNSSQVHSR